MARRCCGPSKDGRYEYVPTQLFPPHDTAHALHLPPIARRRLAKMSSTVHGNEQVGSIYIGNCDEAMDWARDHVAYIIDASNGTSNIT